MKKNIFKNISLLEQTFGEYKKFNDVKNMLFDKLSIQNGENTTSAAFIVQPTNLTNGTFLEKISNSLNSFQSSTGILYNLVAKILNVLMLGFTFYPILLCIELKKKSFLNYFLCSSYIWCMLAFHIFKDIVCAESKLSLFAYLKCFIEEMLSDIELYQILQSKIKHVLEVKKNETHTVYTFLSNANYEG